MSANFLRSPSAFRQAILLFSVFAYAIWAESVFAWAVSATAPATISYGSFASSGAVQTAYLTSGQFSVTDTRGATVGYYATVSVSDLSNGSYVIPKANVAAYVTGATVTTLSGTANPAVQIPSSAGTIGAGYVSMSSATTLVARTNAGGGIYGQYGITPTFRVSIPAYAPVGTYAGTLTLTLIENPGACDQHYTYNGSTCVADTQTVACGGSVIANAAANSSTTYVQTWNGTDWGTSYSWTRSASAGTCTYDCSGGYSWNGSSCAAVSVAYTGSFFPNVTLLAHMNSPSYAVTSTYPDMANNGKTVTVNGSAKISTAQSKFWWASLSNVPATYDGLSFSASDDYRFPGDFTLEAWIYSTDNGAGGDGWARQIITNAQAGNVNTWSFNISWGAANKLSFLDYGGGWVGVTGSTSIPLNTWTHVAVTRQDTTLRLFVNGQLDGTATSSYVYPGSTTLWVGRRESTSSNIFSGNIDEVRITKWVARYTSNFTVPIAAFPDSVSAGDPYYSNVVLLLHMDGANNSKIFRDSANNGKSVTATGDVKLSTAQSKFGGASMSFDWSWDYLTVPDSDDWAFGTKDFTIEFFMRWNAPASARATLLGRVFPGSGSWGDINWVVAIQANGTIMAQASSNGSSGITLTSSVTVNDGAWHHVSLVRYGNVFTLYIDGIAAASTTSALTILDNDNSVFIGQGYSSWLYYGGYLDEIRVTKWVARYTANFASPTSAFSDDPTEDPYFTNVVLLLHGNGANNSTAFFDSANNGRTTAANGDAKISAAQSKFGGASAAFDGNGDYFSVPADSTAFSPGTGDLTIEWWFYLTNINGGIVTNLFGIDNGAGANPKILGYVDSNGAVHFDITPSGWASQAVSANGTVSVNTWYHIAFVRSSGTASIYVNGALVASWTASWNLNNLTAPFNIGYIGEPHGVPMSGYIDEFRVTQWVARYTANFSVATTAFSNDSTGDPYFSNVVLLQHFDGAPSFSSRSYFGDSANNSKTITASGNAKISTAQSKFGGASWYFDGVNSYLSAPDSPEFTLGKEDFTLEFWMNPAQANPASYQVIAGQFLQGSVDGSVEVAYGAGGTYPIIVVYKTAAGANFLSSWQFPTANAWQHIAVTRKGTVLSIYIGGILKNSVDIGANAFSDYPYPFTVGADASGANPYQGYIDDLRFTKGIARYNANFTPPSGALPDGPLYDPYFSNVVLLAHMDGTNNSTVFRDSANNGKTVTAGGDAKISAVQKKYGSTSMYFDGTGDYLSVAPASDFTFGADDFTVEAWIYPSTFASYPIIAAQYQDGVKTNSSFYFGIQTNNQLAAYLYYGNNVTSFSSADNAVPSNQWSHVALVRRGSLFSLYVNGTQVANQTFSGPLNTSSMPLTVGGASSGSYFFSGYIDDLRVTKGAARYAANFTAPGTSFADNVAGDSYFANAILLLHGEGADGSVFFADSANNGKTLTANGNVQMLASPRKFGGTSAYFDGLGSYLSLADSEDFNFGSGDFTIEMWVYPQTIDDSEWVVFTQRDGAWNSTLSSYISFSPVSGWTILAYSGNSYYGSYRTAGVTYNAWTHIALVRNGATVKAYINGVEAAPWTAASNIGSATINNPTTPLVLWIDRWANNYEFRWYIDDVRITKWIARYTANFTPPTAEFSDE